MYCYGKKYSIMIVVSVLYEITVPIQLPVVFGFSNKYLEEL